MPIAALEREHTRHQGRDRPRRSPKESAHPGNLRFGGTVRTFPSRWDEQKRYRLNLLPDVPILLRQRASGTGYWPISMPAVNRPNAKRSPYTNRPGTLAGPGHRSR